MKVVAHPLIVAVALGLLGPTALEVQDEKTDRGCIGSDDANHDHRFSDLEAPEADDFERVQLEWEEARTWL